MEYVIIILAVLAIFFLNQLIRAKGSIKFNKYFDIVIVCGIVTMLVLSLLKKDYGYLPIAFVCVYSLYKKWYPTAKAK